MNLLMWGLLLSGTTLLGATLCGAALTHAQELQTAQANVIETAPNEPRKKASVKVKRVGVQSVGVQSVCAPPRGVRLLVRGYFHVTNSDDGVGDRDVEVYGNVRFNGQQMWRVARDNAINATKGDSDRKKFIHLTSHRYINVMFNDSKTWNLIISGFLTDRDRGSGDDGLWNPINIPRFLNLKEKYDQTPNSNFSGIFPLNGDRNSESADLMIAVTWAGDVF